MTIINQEQVREPVVPENLASIDEVSQSQSLSSQQQAISEEQQYRASAYSLLGSLLREPPGETVIAYISGLAEVAEQGDELSVAMSMLGLAAKQCELDAISDEYHDLFIGLGRGELVPFGSWYLTGFLMEKPLAILRDDLSALGFARNKNSHEPEDHAAALCEVMAMLIAEDSPLEQQSKFYTTHMEPWFGKFFNDLGKAESAVFYRSVGRFGEAFTDLESQYLSMKV